MVQKNILSLKNVTYISNNKKIVDKVSIDLKNNEISVIIGPSGSGKTTLLELLNGMIYPTEGDILYDSNSIYDYDMPYYRSLVNLMFQEPLVIPGTVKDNLLMPFHLEVNKEKMHEEDALKDMLSKCGLNESFLEKDVDTLSGGEKQRVCLSRSLLLHPKVLMLDEPTSALDKKSEQIIARTIKDFKDGGSVLCVTHSYQMIKMADVVIFMSDGLIKNISSSPSKDRIDKFLGVSK